MRDEDTSELSMDNMEFMGVAFTRCMLSGNGLPNVNFDLSSVADFDFVKRKKID